MSKSRLMHYIFYPGSIAVIGASKDPEKERAMGWVGRLLEYGYKGKIYPVNPGATEILGLKAYPSIESIQDDIDYAIITLAAPLVPEAVEKCAQKGVKVVHIFSAGFSETGDPERVKLQEELKRIVDNTHIRAIGPNCFGVYCPASHIVCNRGLPAESGSIGLVCQTGMGMMLLIRLAKNRGLRFSKGISYGNAVDLSAEDFLEYFMSDPETKVIFTYIEGLKDGRRFFNILRECVKVKPVVILKGGLSESGAGAVASHTGSLAGSRRAWQTLFKQTGVIPVESIQEAVEQLVALLNVPSSIGGRRVGLVGRGGGAGVVATDMCEREGLSVPRLPVDMKMQLGKIIPSLAGSSVGNPVEIGLGAFGFSENYAEAVGIIGSHPQIDFIITFFFPAEYEEFLQEGWLETASSQLLTAKRSLSKPLIAVVEPGESVEVFKWAKRLQQRCIEMELATFLSLEDAIKAVSKLIKYYEFKSHGTE